MNFEKFNSLIQQQFAAISTGTMYKVDATKQELWDTYLSSFPEGSNPIYKENTQHDCNCCKSFIRSVGGLVAIGSENQLISIWDCAPADPAYAEVAAKMSALVKSRPIRDIFLHDESHVGTDHNFKMLEDASTLRFEHFYLDLPRHLQGHNNGSRRTTQQVHKRGLEELTREAVDTVLELIAQKSLYRGEEHLSFVKKFKTDKFFYDELKTPEEQDNYCWSLVGVPIRNTVIGSLLVDLSNGKELDYAVGSFEQKVAPANYKRPKALITKAMIENAQEKVLELGIEDSLSRRYAVMDDITINNVLFADRSVKEAKNVFEELAESVPVTKKLGKVEEVDAYTFVRDILPKVDKVELLFENSHTGNLMSLIAPEHAQAPSILKWNNNFSWVYNGEMADSVKERVKKAGGSVTGTLRCSLGWYNYDDLDIHVIEPNGNRIYFSNPLSGWSLGKLDVDMNAGGRSSREAVENITWPNKNKIQEGVYTLIINQYQQRESIDLGFEAEIECNNIIHTFHYDKAVVGNVDVAKFNYSHEGGVEIINSLPTTQASKEVWGIATQQFREVSMIMNSPNHWDGNKTGNKHYFFILKNCKNPDESRGFFNEYLSDDLTKHRKVFEVLGSKLRVGYSDEQLSGLGFSTTMRNSVTCRVTGSFTRTLKINF